MIPLFGLRQRAEDFAARVDEHADATSAASSGTGTPADTEQERLVAIVSGLRRQPELAAASAPRPAFVASLREALVAEAASTLNVPEAGTTLNVPEAGTTLNVPEAGTTLNVPEAAGPHDRRPVRAAGPRRLVAAATAAVVVSGSAGMAAAAEGSLPGEALYPVKRGMEKVDVRLSSTAAARGYDLLSQASTRLVEVEGLLAQGPATAEIHVPPTLRTFTSQAREGADQLMLAYRKDQDARALTKVRSFAASSIGTLESITPSTSEIAGAALREAAQQMVVVDEAASESCQECPDEPVVEVPDILLASTSTSTSTDDADSDEDGTTVAGGGLLGPLVGGLAAIDPLAPLADALAAEGPVDQRGTDATTDQPLDADTSPDQQAGAPPPGSPTVAVPDPSMPAPSAAPSTDASGPSDSDSPQPTDSATQEPEATGSPSDQGSDSDGDPGSGTSEPEPSATSSPTPSPSPSATPSDSAAPETSASASATPTDASSLPAESVMGDAGGEALADMSGPAASAAAKTRGKAHGLTKSPGRSAAR